MPERITMRRIREALRLRFTPPGMSQNRTAEVLSISRSTVQEYWHRFDRLGMTWEEALGLPEPDMEKRLFPEPEVRSERPALDYGSLHQELHRAGVTLQLLWEEYRQVNPDGYRYSQFCDLYRRWKKGLKVYMRQHHVGGERIYVDYSGKRPHLVNPITGEVRPVELFVMVWGASNCTYAEAQETQSFFHWAMGHVRGFSYFGCVAHYVVPDNLKAAVTKACIYDPDLNRGYVELAEHYDFGILPARPKKPRDKAKVEVGVQIVQRWILARLRNRIFHRIEDLNAAIRELLEELNRKPMKKLDKSRWAMFQEVDVPQAKPLPLAPYVYHDWQKPAMGMDYHIEVNRHYYSFPHQYHRQGEHVDVRLTETMVEIFYRTERIACHSRDDSQYRYTTDPAHMPEPHRSIHEQNPAFLLKWAGSIGMNTLALVKMVIASKAHPQQGIRPVLGMLRLGRSVGNQRMENAARFACRHRLFRVQQIKDLLKKGLDRQPLEPETPTGTVANNVNIRGPLYFQERIASL